MGSRARFGAVVKSTGSSPDHADRAVRLTAVRHTGQSGLGDASLFAHGFPGGVPRLHRRTESGIEGWEIESGAAGHAAYTDGWWAKGWP